MSAASAAASSAPFGEPAIKSFVDAALDEARKLENALRSLKTERSVAVLHYAPVVDTVEGEPLEIYPFLGCSRLADAIDRFDNVAAVVHGHAHRGAIAAHTPRGTPVYNCAQMVVEAELRPALRAASRSSARPAGSPAGRPRRRLRRAAGCGLAPVRGSSRAAVSIVSSARRAAT